MLSSGSSPAAAARIGLSDPFHFAVRQCVSTRRSGPDPARRLDLLAARHPPAGLLHLHRGHRHRWRRCRSSATAAKGAARWLQLGGFTLQPSEFVKPALIVLASWMFAEAQKGEGVPGVSIAFGLYGLAVALLLMQPDVGQTVLITIAFGAAFFMAGVPLSWVMRPGRRGRGRPDRSTYFTFGHVAARVHKFLSPDSADTHQIDRRRRGHRRRRPVRARPGRGGDEAPRARPAHRLHLFGRRRGVRPDLLPVPDRACSPSWCCAASIAP